MFDTVEQTTEHCRNLVIAEFKEKFPDVVEEDVLIKVDQFIDGYSGDPCVSVAGYYQGHVKSLGFKLPDGYI